MSLIHEALKKLERRRHGYTAQTLPAGGGPGKKRGKSRLIAPIVLLTLFLAFTAAALYFSRGGGGGGGRGGRLAFLRKSPIESVREAMRKTREAQVKGPSKSQGALQTPRPAEPASFSGHNARGLSLFKSGEFQTAAVEFKAALDAATDENPALKGVALNNLGMAYMAMDDAALAEESFKEALRLKPDYPQALNNYGTLLSKKGDRKKALALFKRAVQADKNYAEAHLNLAILHEKDDMIEDALTHYGIFLDLNALKPAGEQHEKTEEVRKKTRILKTSILFKTGG